MKNLKFHLSQTPSPTNSIFENINKGETYREKRERETKVERVRERKKVKESEEENQVIREFVITEIQIVRNKERAIKKEKESEEETQVVREFVRDWSDARNRDTKVKKRCCGGIMVKDLDCGIIVSEFELQSCSYIDFRMALA